ncbi:MAG TPA: glycosyltransferase 87 family protein [Asticcacaulis sp.]|nr:glycosyltransferase 87 family protein [Asticcacaulis sp.]
MLNMLRDDAFAFLDRITATRWRRIAFTLFFLFPIVGNLIARLRKHGWWLNDFDALICGADHVRRGLSPYDLHPVCAGTWPAVYVYAPQVAQVFAPMSAWGLGVARLVWWIPSLIVMGYLLWYAVLMPVKDAPWRLRLMTLAAIVGSVYACGNIGLILHALITATAVLWLADAQRPKRWPFVVMVILAALIKPVMLTYLVVLLFERRPFLSRIGAAFVTSALGLCAIAAEVLTAGTFGDDWRRTLNIIVMTQQPGISYFGWLNWLGLAPGDHLTLAIVALFMLTTLLAGWVLAESRNDAISRVAIGLGLAQLLNPRLMDYDMMALAPLMAIVVVASQDLGRRFFWAMSWAFTAILTMDVLSNLFEIKSFARSPVTLFVYWLMLLAIAARIALTQKRPEGLPGVFKALLKSAPV